MSLAFVSRWACYEKVVIVITLFRLFCEVTLCSHIRLMCCDVNQDESFKEGTKLKLDKKIITLVRSLDLYM